MTTRTTATSVLPASPAAETSSDVWDPPGAPSTADRGWTGDAEIGPGDGDVARADESVSFRVPRTRRGQRRRGVTSPADAPEPVTYRVPRRHPSRTTRGSSVGGDVAEFLAPIPLPHGSRDTRQPAPGPMEQAVCDLLSDPASPVTHITVVRSDAANVAALEAAAVERGLKAVSAVSPSLRRGWIRLAQSAPGAEAGRNHDLNREPDGRAETSAGAVRGAQGVLSRLANWLGGRR